MCIRDRRRTVRVDTAQTVVLDEADRMLDMGFIHDVTRLLDKMNKRKNLGLFSATISRDVYKRQTPDWTA